MGTGDGRSGNRKREAGGDAGILGHAIAETPIAVLDFETTGLSPGLDRVVEVSVVRVDPGGGPPRLVLDTLVNPERRMAATEVHGIRDADVRHAPRFAEIADELVRATAGCVVAAYNAYFDMKFLEFELGLAGVRELPPFFCLMYLRPMLDLGVRCSLEQACQAHGHHYLATHAAADDAMASAELYRIYAGEISRRSVQTFGDLARLRRYRFVESFRRQPLSEPQHAAMTRGRLVSRSIAVGG